MPLKQSQQDQLRRAIDERRRTLAAELRRDAERLRGEGFRDVAGSVTDRGDEALADLVADLGNAELTRDLTELRALEAAAQRLADGAYGRCASCGIDIPFARLEAEPGALRCVDCQRLHEKTHAHPKEPKL